MSTITVYLMISECPFQVEDPNVPPHSELTVGPETMRNATEAVSRGEC